MTTAFSVPPYTVPLMMPDGSMNRQWWLFFQQIWQNGGGYQPVIPAELAAQIAAIDNQLEERASVFAPRRPEADVRGDAYIGVTRDAQGYALQLVPETLPAALGAFLPHQQPIADVRPGANITVVRDAQGYVVAGPTPPVVEQFVDGARAFLPHLQQPIDVRPGSNVTIVRDAQGFVISATSAATPVEQLVDGMRALMPHLVPAPDVRPGTNVTVVRDAQGYVISCSSTAVDDASNILANQVFGG